MDNNFDNEASFTFKELWKLVKVSGVHIVIFCIVAALIMAAVSLGVIFSSRTVTSSVSAVIQYNHAGIEKGLDPNGSKFDVASDIKTVSIIGSAIDEANNAGANIATIKIAVITRELAVQGIVSGDMYNKVALLRNVSEISAEQLNEYMQGTYMPSSYLLSFNNLQSLGISSADAITLLNEIIKAYSKNFKEKYIDAPIVSNYMIKQFVDTEQVMRYGYDFVELSEIINAQLKDLQSLLDDKISTSNEYRSGETRYSFADLLESVNMIKGIDVVRYDALVYAGALSENYDASLSYLGLKLKETNSLVVKYKKNIAEYKLAIAQYQNGVTIDQNSLGSGTSLVILPGTPTAQYNSLFNEYINEQKKCAEAEAESFKLTERIADFENNKAFNTEENRALALSALSSLALKLSDIIDDVNATNRDYYESTPAFNPVSVASAAGYSESVAQTSYLLMLTISAIVVVLAAVLAVVYTHIRVSRNKVSNVVNVSTEGTNE